MVLGKLSAGMLNILLLITQASLPLFSLVFFFGGVSPTQVASALLIYVVTALWIATVSLFCSTLFHVRLSRQLPPASFISARYTPFLLALILLSSANDYQLAQLFPDHSRLIFAWNPCVALVTTYPAGGQNSNPFFYMISLGYSSMTEHPPITLGNIQLSYWTAYVYICLLTGGFFLTIFGNSTAPMVATTAQTDKQDSE